MLLSFLAFYRQTLTNLLGGSCRFEPSCSEYAVQCVNMHSPGRACRLILRRLIRCRPFGPFGFDPVPSKCDRGCGEY